MNLLAAQGDERWDHRFGRAGVSIDKRYAKYKVTDAEVSCVARYGKYYLIGGLFNLPAEHIALWNDSLRNWENIGSGLQRDSIQLYQGGYPFVPSYASTMIQEGDSVWIIGQFDHINGTATPNLICFSFRTKTFSAPLSVPGFVHSFVRRSTGIVLSGVFHFNNGHDYSVIQQGQHGWEPLSEDSVQNVECSISLYHDTLFAAGRKPFANGTTFGRWDGKVWQPLYRSLLQAPVAIQGTPAYISADASYLYLIGWFSGVVTLKGDTIRGRDLFRWNGSTWTSLIDSIQYEQFYMVPVIGSCGKDLYFASSFSSIHNIMASGIARFDEATHTWQRLGSGITRTSPIEYIQASGIYADSEQVVLHGTFRQVGSEDCFNLAKYDLHNRQWSSFSPGTDLLPNSSALLINDNEQLVALGNFDHIGESIMQSIATFDSHQWHQRGMGISGGTYLPFTNRGYLFYAAEGFHSAQSYRGELYIGGMFGVIGSTTCSGLSRYNDTNCRCVGSGIQGAHYQSSTMDVPPFVRSMCVTDDQLFVCGDFSQCAGVNANSIARFDGQNWQSLASKVNTDPMRFYFEHLFADSSHGVILVSQITLLNALKCNAICRWSKGTWSTIGYDPADSVGRLWAGCTDADGNIYVAGHLRSRYTRHVSGIGMWDGSTWHDLNNDSIRAEPYITCMIAHGDYIYVGGTFDHIGNTTAQNLALYNRKTKVWSALGSGVSNMQTVEGYRGGAVSSMALVGDTLYVSGDFCYAGNVPSFGIAAWHPEQVISVEPEPEVTKPTNTLYLTPNPSSSTAVAHFQVEESDQLDLSVIDELGRECLHIFSGFREAGNNQCQLNTSTLPSSVYTLLLRSSKHYQATRFCVVH